MTEDAPAIDDAQLIDWALAGQSDAFGQLVMRYQDRLYTTLVHVLRSPEDAQDVAQMAFTQAFVKLETFQRSSAFYTWLYRIAVNLALSHRRRRKPTVSLNEDSGHAPPEPSDNGQAPPHGRLEQQERVQTVQAALARLSEEHRMILMLREMEDCSYEQISEMLQIPLGTVRSRLYRARGELQQLLSDQNPHLAPRRSEAI